MAGLLLAALMAVALIVVAILFGVRPAPEDASAPVVSTQQLRGGTSLGIGLIVIIFGGFKAGIATGTEISALAVVYALISGGVLLRELGAKAAARCFVHACC